MFTKFLGCLFVLLFGVVFVAFAFLQQFFRVLFGQTPRSGRSTNSTSNQQHSSAHTSSGNAHRESGRKNSRQRRSGKIFEKNEGEYVDFEEV